MGGVCAREETRLHRLMGNVNRCGRVCHTFQTEGLSSRCMCAHNLQTPSFSKRVWSSVFVTPGSNRSNVSRHWGAWNTVAEAVAALSAALTHLVFCRKKNASVWADAATYWTWPCYLNIVNIQSMALSDVGLQDFKIKPQPRTQGQKSL